ncbi:helix-turn-helix domain-containing protein [Anaerosinus massiliensis]|uniref:helix-turn-helix domain-containing protein n=1 Tax=Massilibacillus massiliensis TaxID=1806837 RepID=UPI000AAC7360|nr:helix-turn-helix domain-containing protein [Massilibacillus massiliensis]
MNIDAKIGQRILSLRKGKDYTQEQLSSFLNVTPQAISKWENNNALPDTALLPRLAEILNTSIDKLLTGYDVSEKLSPYDSEYIKEEYYWGLQTSKLAAQVVNLINDKTNKRLLDIGSGEGRDSIYFANYGFRVDSLEISKPGVEKIKQYSNIKKCNLNVIHANMIGYELSDSYDVIYSMGALQFIPLEQRRIHFEKYKKHTKAGGLNAHLVFVEKPFIKTAPDWERNEFFYTSGDLANYYHDWEIVSCEEQIIDCNSSNIYHQHAVNSIIARKIKSV